MENIKNIAENKIDFKKYSNILLYDVKWS